MAKANLTPEQRVKFERARFAVSNYGLWKNPEHPMDCDCIVSAGFMQYVVAIAAVLPDDALEAFLSWLEST